MRWVNDNSHFTDLMVEQGSSADGEYIVIYDRAAKGLVQIHPNHAHPRATIFKLGRGGPPLLPVLSCIKGTGLVEREVWHYTDKTIFKRLRVGLTIHKSVFSSLPHPFEKGWRAAKELFEEVFYIMTPGLGLMEGVGRLGYSNQETAWPIRDKDLLAVPMGWHRVVALPNENGSIPSFAYVWAYLAKLPEWEKE